MQSESHSEYLKICNEYNVILNKVNLLLVKEHSYRTQKQQYQQQLETINSFIVELESFQQNKNQYSSSIVIQKQHKYLQEIIYQNKTQLLSLQRKLQSKDLLIKQLSNIKTLQQKYSKLLSSEYQSSLQQKLSMIRGKVDDLKKKLNKLTKIFYQFNNNTNNSWISIATNVIASMTTKQKTKILKIKFKFSKK